MSRLILCLLASLFVAGCSDKAEKPAPAAAPKKEAAPVAQKPAPQVAKVDCPAKFTFPERSANAPVDDVLGIRQGAKLSDAMLFLKCRPGSHVVFEESTSGLIQNLHGQRFRQTVTATDGVSRSKPIDWAKEFKSGGYSRGMKDGGTRDFEFVSETVFFWTLGFQGQETVWGVSRRQFFKPDEKPTVEKVVEQLTAKYGKPSTVWDQSAELRLNWHYDAGGQQTTPKQMDACNRGGMWSDGGQVFEQCHLTVTAGVFRGSNRLIADSVWAAVIDQGKYFTAMREFEQALAAARTQQHANEAAKAAQGGSAPKF